MDKYMSENSEKWVSKFPKAQSDFFCLTKKKMFKNIMFTVTSDKGKQQTLIIERLKRINVFAWKMIFTSKDLSK